MRLCCCSRSSCRSSRGTCGYILLCLHVHVVGGLYAGCFPAHRYRGCVCDAQGQMLFHPGDKKRGPRECMMRNQNVTGVC